jgi:hypothetical protein
VNAEKKFHYVDVSSGRYFCAEHGGFCDERDGFQKECLVCGEAKAIICINRTQRMLKLINGLQERSKRSVGLLSAIVGGVGILTL